MYRKFVMIDFMNYAKERKWHWLIGITSKDWSKRMKFWCIVNNYEFNSKTDRMPELDEITRQPIFKNNKKVTGSFEMVWITTKNKEETKEETLEIDYPETDDEF